MLPIIRIRRAQRKIGSFGFACVSACGWGKTKCANCGLAEFQIFFALVEKLKHEAVGYCVGKRSTRWSVFVTVFVTVFLMSNGQV
jgi:hypothetical protein